MLSPLKSQRTATLSTMQAVKLLPEAQLFVCANRREAGSPLGAGCSDHGERLYDALKDEVLRRGLVRAVWITKTYCLGICPKEGATVALYPRQRMWAGSVATDAEELVDAALEKGPS
jgi:(2Fe-2S) ferredoxin